MDMVQRYLDNTGGWVYMFDIIDIYTREIFGHHISLRCKTDETLQTLKNVLETQDIEEVMSG